MINYIVHIKIFILRDVDLFYHHVHLKSLFIQEEIFTWMATSLAYKLLRTTELLNVAF